MRRCEEIPRLFSPTERQSEWGPVPRGLLGLALTPGRTLGRRCGLAAGSLEPNGPVALAEVCVFSGRKREGWSWAIVESIVASSERSSQGLRLRLRGTWPSFG